MQSEYLINFLNEKNIPLVTKKRKTYITYAGFDQQYTYVLKDGIIKISITQQDGRNFNIDYIQGPDIVSIMRDEVSAFTASPFTIRVESEMASFYTVPRVLFWQYVNNDRHLQAYIKEYYRRNLSRSLRRAQLMIMNGKTGAVCAFIYDLVQNFGHRVAEGYLVDFQVTNEDIGGFCGISTSNSVNRILHKLKEEQVIEMDNQKILVKDPDYIKQFVL
ncbi:Crp/Fnr family transcriptional regulator [Mageeibacillus indolicus]|jgi:hypothetical protein|uniref:Crp/Fnr family transcriptional regulator n=1 Tax=Mageeibacillus indolicus TaxID=884684 RepID=A0A2J8B598_9FIRM|nr:Crp/Fnr family transcriptional regulator [Mageeibacillus indolicus]KFA57349.1 Crp/Fnr family transcriptional regulator [Mageeibacillus indolicus 0009-5]PNH19938.1 Crp/Fnr family transcriptional regulator [Mageeibacillus indolicus]